MKGQKGQIWLLFYLGGNFLKNCMITCSLFMQEASKEGTNELPKDGFDWITLKVIFQGSKGLKKSNFAVFDTFCQFTQKRSDNFSLYLVYSFFRMILINCQEMDFIELFGKVIFKVGKVRFSPFSRNYWYYSIVTKCCPNLLHHVAFLFWNQSCPKIWKVWNHSKCHCQGQKGPIWTFVIYFS